MSNVVIARRLSASTARWALQSSTSITWALFAGGLALSPLADFLSVRAAHGFDSEGGDARFSLVVRGTMVAGLLLLLLVSGRIRLSSWRTALLAMVAITASAATYAFADMSSVEFAQQAVFVLKVFSFFVCLAALSGMGARQLEKLEPFMRLTLLAYAVAIVTGAVFSIDLFRSYWADTQIRSGYKGIVYAQNEASALMIVGLAYGLLRVLKFGWSAWSGVLVGTIVLASCLVGTKAAMGGTIAMICSYFFCRHNVPQATVRALTFLGLLAVLAAAAYLSLPGVQSAADLSFQYFMYQHDHVNSGGILTMVLSGRDVKFLNVWDEVAKDGYVPLLTGGYPVVRYLVEIDVPDLVLAMGLPVCVFYLGDLGKAFVCGEGGAESRFGKWFFIVLMATACTAGHILVSAIVSPYLAMIAVLIKRAAHNRRYLIEGPHDE
ncbi:O-antigen ligase-like membrane protein [Paraburkholderia sp. BL18I3N2]|uniref:O-antigen ligase family protein n=1 Tax=Paraburkholderia sp. BL18I3N2 TaxID=1938799 RepID=UPI000D05B5E4|nr:O-antigen ligase family protein [Paraburkholderia sp. BL18I3N2]PRX33287.1 O-antigen ligase-like membrane protein [Paraburkholderia sp. BL18I3N2]